MANNNKQTSQAKKGTTTRKRPQVHAKTKVSKSKTSQNWHKKSIGQGKK